MDYRKITIFELNRRLTLLVDFKKNIEDYFSKIDYDEVFGGIVDNGDSLKIREEINRDLNSAYQYLIEAGISCSTGYSPPGTTSLTESIDIFFNIFNLSELQQSHQMVLDLIDQGIGVYESEKTKSKIRTFNPFWWLWKLIKIIIRIPFFILNEAGFDSDKFENSILGKIIKLALEVAVGVVIAYIVFKFGWNK